MSGRSARAACLSIALISIAIFLSSVARYYHRDTWFTALLGLPAGHEYEAPALRAIPHYDYASAGVYDGQFYVQRALDPLVRDPQVDRAMDLAPFRARRILFSWTAYVAGLGRPAWIVEAYALQNVVAWLVLAVLFARWLPPTTPRGLAGWIACLFSHGLLWSVRFSLLDGPSLVLTALAVKLAEDGRPILSAALAGINGLGRETNVLGVLAQPLPRDWRAGARWLGAVVLVALPILIWEDYLRSIYRSTIFAGAEGQTTRPGAAMVATVGAIWHQIATRGVLSGAGLSACIVVPLLLQAVYLASRPRIGAPWWRVAIGYAALMLVLDRVLWDPATAAITRVLLPMTVGFNVLLLRESSRKSFWAWFLGGNLHLIPAVWVL
jgi:hypothetical protein